MFFCSYIAYKFVRTLQPSFAGLAVIAAISDSRSQDANTLLLFGMAGCFFGMLS